MTVTINTNTASINPEQSAPIPSQKNICDEIFSKIAAFQQQQGKWLTSNCQHIQEGDVHYYGIHKAQQMQHSGDLQATLQGYREIKSFVLQHMQLPANTKVVQVVGDSASFSQDGTKAAKAFLKSHLPEDHVVLYGYTGHADSDGARCVNAAVSDIVFEKGMQKQTIANLVGFHTPLALKNWDCSGPALQQYIIVYGDDETCRKHGTVFGDDITTSDFFADNLLMLEGGVQSFRQACNALLLDQNITILPGIRAEPKAYLKESIQEEDQECPIEILTPYFAAAKFLKDVVTFLTENKNHVSQEELQTWYQSYFGRGKCYIGDPNRGDFDTKQHLLDDAWQLFVQEKLYLKISALVKVESK